MRHYLAILLFLFLVGCNEPIDKSLKADLTVHSSLSLKGHTSGVSEAILPGVHPIALNFRSAQSSDGQDQIVLNVADKRFVFAVPDEKLSSLFVEEHGFVGKFSAEELGQPYDIKLTYSRKISDGPLEVGGDRYCMEEAPIGSVAPPRYRLVRYYYYEQLVEEYYHIAFLQPNSGDETGVAAIEVFDQRVEMVDSSPDPFCL